MAQNALVALLQAGTRQHYLEISGRLAGPAVLQQTDRDASWSWKLAMELA